MKLRLFLWVFLLPNLVFGFGTATICVYGFGLSFLQYVGAVFTILFLNWLALTMTEAAEDYFRKGP